MKHNITKPIGLTAPCAEVEATCQKAYLYRHCGLKPAHLILPLDSGSGRTTFLEYMTDRYKESGVLDFASGLDDYVEITLDGSLHQLKQAFSAIDSAAVYTNDYTGIVGMDISSLASHLNETQVTEFLSNSKRICEHACAVFFVHSLPSRNEERLLEKLCEGIENIRRLETKPYTPVQICDLMLKALDDRRILVRNEELFRSLLLELVKSFCISSVKDALSTVDLLIPFADFSGFTPAVDEKSLKSLIQNWQKPMERRELK